MDVLSVREGLPPNSALWSYGNYSISGTVMGGRPRLVTRLGWVFLNRVSGVRLVPGVPPLIILHNSYVLGAMGGTLV